MCGERPAPMVAPSSTTTIVNSSSTDITMNGSSVGSSHAKRSTGSPISSRHHSHAAGSARTRASRREAALPAALPSRPDVRLGGEELPHPGIGQQ